MEFTSQQERAVKDRNTDILVSAGAGAGKTRVLVSRIADLITDSSEALGADEILVMTFTNAAAQEMKERIGKELSDRLVHDPDNIRLRRQIRLVRHADISTVHSFCSRLLRSHFQEAGLDPSFRIGEEGEMLLLKNEAMEELLEESYASGNEDFKQVVEAFAPGRDDHNLEDLIGQLYLFSRGFPDLPGWFDRQLNKVASLADLQLLEESEPVRRLLIRANDTVARLSERMAFLRNLLSSSGLELPVRLDELLTEDELILDSLAGLHSYEEAYKAFGRLTFARMPGGVRKEERDYPYKEDIKSLHGEIREELNELAERDFASSPEEICKEQVRILPCLSEFARLVLRFEEIYMDKKREQNVYDFDDLEHMTLNLLVDHYDADGEPVPSETAAALSRKYKEIFVDEYQDTSLIQETIIKALHPAGVNHLFAVGDIKQSIYRFRQARPDLFAKRLRAARSGEAGESISLQDNFRSASRVICLCNKVFSQLMDEEFGGISYDDSQSLRMGPGSGMEENEEPSELLLLLEDEEKDQLPFEYDALYAETAMIAAKIRELTELGYQYSDMVILLRTGSRAETMAEYLLQMGVPAVCETRTGYFHTREVAVILNYLAVIDNVYQDIPLASVLLSPIGGMTEEELAHLRSRIEIPLRDDYSLYDLLKLYAQEPLEGEEETAGEASAGRPDGQSGDLRNPALKEKARSFLTQLAMFRSQRKEMPLHQLIWNIYQETGFYYDVLLMSEGERRRENLNMLLKKAEEYEKTVFKGLFYFIRYMEQLKSYEIEPAGAAGSGETENRIRIMTIHKSKGLEFPVVFVSALSGQFNFTDTNRTLLWHPELGLGPELIDPLSRTRRASLLKNMLKDQIKKETLEEELRILYVAMTRARNRLILTGILRESMLEKHRNHPMSLYYKTRARCFLDWILPLDLEESRILHLHHLSFPETSSVLNDRGEGLESLVKDLELPKDLSAVEKAFTYRYPYEDSVFLKRKYSVSELKKLSMTAPAEDENEDALHQSDQYASYGAFKEESIPLPDFLKEEKSLAPTMRGTIVHKVMELLPFGRINSKEDLRKAIGDIENLYPLSSMVSMEEVLAGAEAFLFTGQGDWIRAMDREGRLFKEAPFTISLPASFAADHEEGSRDGLQGQGTGEEEEYITVQGIIDAYGEDEDGLLLLDYKTDRIRPGEEGTLLDRYRKQMLYYKTALEMLVKKPVTRTYIYSFALQAYLLL